MRALVWLNVCQSVIVVWLVVTVGRQWGERDDLRQDVSMATKRVSALLAKPPMVGSNARPADPPTTQPQTTSAATTTNDANLDATADAAARLILDYQQHFARLNALTGYDAGFIALHLPPETVARAKEIILAQRQAGESARKGARSMEEVMAAVEPVRMATTEQLTALLGRDTYEQLEAYQRERHFDWTIGTDMWDGDEPLTAEQLHSLALATVQTKFEEGNILAAPKPAQSPNPATGLSAQDLTLLVASSGFLSPAQQEILRQNLIDDDRYNAAMRGFAAKQRQLWGKTH